MMNLKRLKMAKVGEIFQGKTCLHVIIWDRFCERSHISGLRLMKELVEQFDLAMPMLRPIGRRPHNYSEDSKTEFGKPPPNTLSDGIPSAPLLNKKHTAHCEMWVQVADAINDDLIDFFKKYINTKDSIFGAFLDRKNPEWQPLGDSIQNCNYAMARDELGRKIVCDIGEKQLPAFLKLIWYRSSVVISGWLSDQGDKWSGIDPLRQKTDLHDIMAKIFIDINPREYGIRSSFDSIDPSGFGVSHMAAFAINAITKVSHIYTIEDYFGNGNVTQPHSYPCKEKFLKQFL
ncbi:MAG: hypothetical protein JRJ03_14440 [Deltaproteobacteria bacterium]|nr:hypothetical protein [Deltaproteobacteria bacterium]